MQNDLGPVLTKKELAEGVSPTTLRRFFPLFAATAYTDSFRLNDGERYRELGFNSPAHFATTFSLTVTKNGLADRPKYGWHRWDLTKVPISWLLAVGLPVEMHSTLNPAPPLAATETPPPKKRTGTSKPRAPEPVVQFCKGRSLKARGGVFFL